MVYFILLVTAIILIFYAKYIYNHHGTSIPFLILFFFYAIWSLVSIIYIDSGTYISEQDIISYFTGSSIAFIFIMLPLFIFTPKFISDRLEKNKSSKLKESIIKNTKFLQNTIYILSILVLVYLYANLYISGIPLFTPKITNFNFYSTYSKLPFASIIQSTFSIYFLVFHGMMFSEKSTKKKTKFMSFLYYILMIVYRILFGEKFYPFLVYSAFFFIPYLMKLFHERKNKGFFSLKQITIVLMIVCVLLGGVLYKYSKNNKKDTPVEQLISRIFSLQSHMFWGYDKYVRENELGLDFKVLCNELYAGLTGVDKFDPQYGLTKIMYIVSPTNIVTRYMNNKTRFYGGYWTLSIGYLGYFFTAVYSILIAWLIAYFSSKLALAIQKKDYCFLFLTTNCFYILFTYFNEANFSFLFSTRMILFTVCIVFYPTIVYNKDYLKNLYVDIHNKIFHPFKKGRL